MNIDELRAETPGVGSGIYLNNAGCSLMPQPVIGAVQNSFALEARTGGFPARMQETQALDAVYASVAALINAKPSEIALMGSHTDAWQSVFYGLGFSEGEKILTGRAEYGANYVAFLQMRKRTGCEIEIIPCDASGASDAQALEKMIDDRVKLIALTWISTNGGLVNPAAEIGKVARAHAIPYLLDACQAVGQMPVDVAALGCDYLCATGRKWLRGPKGTGFLYVREERLENIEPATIDDFGASWRAPDEYELRGDARRFETHEHAPALRLGLGAAVDYARALGLDEIRHRVRHLAMSLRAELARIPGVTVRDLGSEHAGLVTFSHERVAAADITAALHKAGVWVKTVPRAGALLDTTDRELGELVRVSPHYFNLDSELESFLKALHQALGP